MCHLRVEDTDWQYSEFSHYDLGQAVAHMTLQAQAQGLSVRQFRAFDRAGLTAEFAVPQHWEVTTMSAIGILPSALGIDGTGEAPSRSRQGLGEIVWSTTASSLASRQE